MTIEQKIQKELERLSKENTEIHSVADKLNEKFNKLIGEVKDHLGEISNEMREFDKHDASHSKAVLEIIEKLLQEKHIEELTLLEAMVLRFCCYFHDMGMILPAFCKPLLEQVENDPKAELKDGLMTWLRVKGNDFDSRKELFLLPGKRDQYHDFLIRELVAYRDFRLGLEERPEDIPPEEYIQVTRHHYLRKHHGERSKTYAANLGRFFAEVIHGSEAELAEVIGDVCAAHSWEIEKVRKLPAKKELFLNCTELSCNVRYLAMLLRLGDLLHFGPERASKTLYLERRTMNPESDLHWLAKQGTRGYVISPTPSGGVNIAYHGSFDKPNEYYFVQGHLSWVNEELNCYEAFRRQMEKAFGDQRYDLGLPEKVNGDHMTARGFTPNRDFKFRLEHRNIIELLMGARLYRDEFMCLRELYQNALDACRCMRAERPGQETEIEFGLGEDDDGKYLYCRDQGTGMTMDIIKNYLLRIGNSYYKSEEFRRKNAHWGDAVAPVSEFGIGLLSCYMIADRIDVITRHYTAVAGEKPIWISMTDNDDFGYQRETNWFQENELGEHGTIVKLYLKEKFISMVTGYIPDSPEDVGILQRYCRKSKKLSVITDSLYARIRNFVHLPELGIHLFIRGECGRIQVTRQDDHLDLSAKIPMLISYGIKPATIISHHSADTRKLFGRRVHNGESPTFAEDIVKWRGCFLFYACKVRDNEHRAEAIAYIHLPVNPTIIYSTDFISGMDNAYFGYSAGITIDGMPTVANRYHYERRNHVGIQYHFWGQVRPYLTVDRSEIRTIPETVTELRKKLDFQLQEILLKTIRDHFAIHPDAITDSARYYLVEYLFQKFGVFLASSVLKRLCTDLYSDYRFAGATIEDWLSEADLLVDGEFLLEDQIHGTHEIVKGVIATATEICIHEGKIHVKRDNLRAYQYLCEHIYAYSVDRNVIKTDNWPDEYIQYDAVRNYAGFVPERVFRLLDANGDEDLKTKVDDEQYSSHSDNQRLCALHFSLPCASAFRIAHPVYMKILEWEDVLTYFRCGDSKSTGQISQWAKAPFIEDGNKRYILYIFINPKTLSEEERVFVEKYKDIPQYLECVEKGWSILFYNYKDGYVIAPGIQKREDMLKLLPREALEHDDGLEYYFTDDTFAF